MMTGRQQVNLSWCGSYELLEVIKQLEQVFNSDEIEG
jgi:hypothetical protein